MTAKERNEYLTRKWDFLLDKLSEHKASRAIYAKIFEETAMHSNSDTLKLVLPTLQKILYLVPTIKYSASSKNNVLLCSIAKELVIDGWSIMPDGASTLVKLTSEKVQQLFEKEELTHINYIRLAEQPGILQIYAFF